MAMECYPLPPTQLMPIECRLRRTPQLAVRRPLVSVPKAVEVVFEAVGAAPVAAGTHQAVLFDRAAQAAWAAQR